MGMNDHSDRLSKKPWMRVMEPVMLKMVLEDMLRQYENLKMEESETLNGFTTKLIEIGNQLRIHGEEKTDYQLVQKVLISLPERFDSIVAVLEQTKDLSVLSITDLIGTLKAHEKRLNNQEERSNEGAFYGENFVSKRGNKHGDKSQNKAEKWCDFCTCENHNESDCWRKQHRDVSLPTGVRCFVSKRGNKHGDKSQNKAEKWCDFCTCDNHNESDCWRKQHRDVSLPTGVRCFVCNKPGHVVKDCRLRRAERADLSLEETDEEVVNEGHILFIAVEEESSSNVNDETWLVDSGCTNHMTKK